MKPTSFVDVARILDAEGWEKRPAKGSHLLYYCPCGKHVVTLPNSGSASKSSNLRAARNAVRSINRCPSSPFRRGK